MTTTSDDFVCGKCFRVCKNKQGLAKHQNVCLKIAKGESFLQNEAFKKPKKSVNYSGKILPLSQPLADFDEALDQVSNIVSTIATPINGAGHPEAVDTVAMGDCSICKEDQEHEANSVCCGMCKVWTHRKCLFLTHDEYNSTSEPWYCVTCLSIRSNKIEWGSFKGEIEIKAAITSIYNEIIGWRKNLIMVPRGRVGSDFIKEITNIINQFTNPSSKWSRLALAKVHIFIPMMLQKPSSKSKAKDHVKYLEKRLKLWKSGNLHAIMTENREIQNKLRRNQDKKQETKEKNFIRLMLMGKISQAMKFINNEDNKACIL